MPVENLKSNQELLNQLDGFDIRGDVKVIMAMKRIETLDPVLIRPGQINPNESPLTDVKMKHTYKFVLVILNHYTFTLITR